jgi:hypothetical protein
MLDFEASVGLTRDVNGVDVAIVPPTPVLLVGDWTFTGTVVALLLVIEHAVGCTVVVGVISPWL